MAKRIRKRKCKNCGELYDPEPRSVKRQKYCGKPQCRKASKAASQRRWLGKPENRDYFKGASNVARVQAWRKEHPGYSQRKVPKTKKGLQDHSQENREQNQTDKSKLTGPALQDVFSSKDELLLGVIANLTGSVLQEDIAFTALKMRKLGRDILESPNHLQGGIHDRKESIGYGQGP